MERIEKLKQMLAATPGDCFIMHALGLEHIKINEVANAIRYFEQVISTDENYTGTYYHLAKAYEKVNEEAKAITMYEKGIAVAIRQKDNHARNELQMALDDISI